MKKDVLNRLSLLHNKGVSTLLHKGVTGLQEEIMIYVTNQTFTKHNLSISPISLKQVEEFESKVQHLWTVKNIAN